MSKNMINIGDTWIDIDSIETIQATPKPNWEHAEIRLVAIRLQSGHLLNVELTEADVRKVIDLVTGEAK